MKAKAFTIFTLVIFFAMVLSGAVTAQVPQHTLIEKGEELHPFPTHEGAIQQMTDSQAWNVTLIGQIGGFAKDIAVAGDYAYVSDYDYNLHIIDVSIPSTPVEVGFFDAPGHVLDVAVVGDYAYVADWDLRIIDVSSSTSPVEVGFYDTPGYAGNLTVAGKYAYVAASYAGLRIIDVSSPTSPIEVGFNDTQWAEWAAVAGDYAYTTVDGYEGRLSIIDVSVPSAPVEVGFYNLGRYTGSGAVSGNYAYIGKYEGLAIIDVSMPSAPVGVGYCLLPEHNMAGAVAVAGKYAYVAAEFAGLRIIDVSFPSAPLEVGFYDTTDYDQATDVTVVGNYVYVANTTGGLLILAFNPPVISPIMYLPLVLRNP